MKKTRILQVDPHSPQAEAIREAAQVLREGGLVAFPTETLYGLGANATDPGAIEAVFSAKRRPKEKPLIILASDLDMVKGLVVAVDDLAWELMNRFWPGPLTLILEASPHLPSALTGYSGKLGLRIPDSTIALSLVRECSFPVTASSANRSGGKDPVDGQTVWQELEGTIDLLLDGGCTAGIPSTLLDLTTRPPQVIRQGAVSHDLLWKIIDPQ